MADLTCKNCEEPIKKGWKSCPKCGANLELGKYSADDDPLNDLREDVNEMKTFLEDKFGDDERKKKGGNSGKGKEGKRKPLFG